MKTLFEKSVVGRRAYVPVFRDIPDASANLADGLKRNEPCGLPELSELDVIRLLRQETSVSTQDFIRLVRAR